MFDGIWRNSNRKKKNSIIFKTFQAEDERGKKPEDVAENKEIKKAVIEEQKRDYLCLEFLTPSQGFASEYSLLSKIWEKK